jgi:hypothetical protein
VKKYILEVYEDSEPEYLIYEVNIEILLSSLDIGQVGQVREALKNKREIKLMSISSKELKQAELRERD